MKIYNDIFLRRFLKHLVLRLYILYQDLRSNTVPGSLICNINNNIRKPTSSRCF
ncbi:hypothetical protein [Fowlpox virus]|uniref:Uncharacterized protein n=1 Tax=Fowlpox virus TaxID=10261 RepID=A0A891LWS6_FOWPV|nr:hypothetical protein [Fowlpox virus]UNS14491.1 ALPV-327 [Albatrosspox virus]UQT20543.1 hypothetical protein [Fowlpox virus]UQT20790.1 hypothetical protein [Fowlpox virus]